MIFHIFWSMTESQEIQKYKNLHVMFFKICKKIYKKLKQPFSSKFQIKFSNFQRAMGEWSRDVLN
jgi:hypothetical protein